ncbi:CBS domain-containing protein [Robertmurraya yapensis]|uniref:CBS domain-containing protein n=2 Tax=Bacillaceae TaxID=186817 RepID=A0A3S0I839_9BACI|nr:acetoin utilization AcuB family protein [Bacillus yapensis]RTR29573.1 CBS domain-containing protein [Bacillus yapensis]TKS94919.1 CBS domain-containing protein [Bacillus yapensis]
MIVEEIMIADVCTLASENTIGDAIQLMAEKRIKHIPIVDGEQRLIGIVTDRDIKEYTPSIFFDEGRMEALKMPLAEIMKTDLITGHPLDFVEDVAAIFYENKIGCLPIIKDHRLVGIITQTDLLHTLVELTGAHQPGSQIEIRVRNKMGMLFRLFSDIQNCKVNILSVLVYPDKKDEDFKIIALRIQTMNPLRLIEELEKSGHQVLWPNLPGMEA